MIRITIVMAALLLVLGCQEAPSTDGSAMSSTLVGAQPLHFAATNGDVELVKLLLDRGATINAATQDGWTALHFACLRGDKGLLQLLHEPHVFIVEFVPAFSPERDRPNPVTFNDQANIYYRGFAFSHGLENRFCNRMLFRTVFDKIPQLVYIFQYGPYFRRIMCLKINEAPTRLVSVNIKSDGALLGVIEIEGRFLCRYIILQE